jgi:hypothetical protein
VRPLGLSGQSALLPDGHGDRQYVFASSQLKPQYLSNMGSWSSSS